MPDLSPAQIAAELKRLNEENEELRYKVNLHEKAKQMGQFTIPDIMAMRGIEPADGCENCMGLGVSPHGTGRRCPSCGGSGNAKNHWAVLQ